MIVLSLKSTLHSETFSKFNSNPDALSPRCFPIVPVLPVAIIFLCNVSLTLLLRQYSKQQFEEILINILFVHLLNRDGH